MEDSELIERAKEGDVAAYEDLVRRHQQPALRLATLVAGARDAEDAVQEAFIKAYGALGRFKSGSAFRPWILKIVANEAKNRIRSGKRQGAVEIRLAESRQSGDTALPPEEAVLAGAAKQELITALIGLSERDRLVVAYRFLLDLSETETAEALGVRPGTVKSRLSRALERLRKQLPNEVTDNE